MLVLEDIYAIVEGNEIVVPHAPEGKDGNYRKDHADSGNLPRLMGCGSYGNGLPGQRIWRAPAMGIALS
jgi:hypothetical protein